VTPRKLLISMVLLSFVGCKTSTINKSSAKEFGDITSEMIDDSPTNPEYLLIPDLTPDKLICRRPFSSRLTGDMTYRSAKGDVPIASFTQGQVGSCEMARRAARKGIVCIETSGGYKAINLETRATVKSFRGPIGNCLAYTQHQGTEVADDDLQLIDPSHLGAYLKNIPKVSDPQINAVLDDSDTIWYDENSMVFAYQDSFGNPTGPEGLRANRVGYDVGSTTNIPDIRALTEYFELQAFKYPFAITAGRLDRGNAQAIYFWRPPRDAQGNKIPVAWWKNGSHWHWVFPVGTVFGELLLVRDGSTTSEWYTHEIRTRVREINRWRTDIFRPFTTATEFASSIKRLRSNWAQTDLAQLVSHLENPNTLTPGRLDSGSYERAVASIDGYYDVLPETKDYALIRAILSKTRFKSALNTEWKRSGDKVSYAPATHANFQIVPKDFIAGLLQNDDKSCIRCHDQTGRPIGQLDRRATLYGEIWGEDEIFTWHPFKAHEDIYTVSDGSRVANPRLVKAGLLIQKKPSSQDPVYRELPRPYTPYYK
jgi:hypothetical protein